jgi:deoxyribose-phosphate aldolase
MGLLIKTPVGNIVHTSDFKFDNFPVNEKPTDFKKLESIAENGIHLLMCDSTGAEEPGHSLSEKDIFENMDKIFAGAKDLKAICRLQNTKVIIGSGFLTDDDIAKASQVVKKAGAICVKTATEKDPLENRELKEKGHHLEIMRKNAPQLLIKASGNIKTLKDVKLMIKYGADIIGSSSGVSIMENK